MNNKEYISDLAQRSGYTQGDTQRMVNTVTDAITQALEEGQNVQISGFGSFEVKKRLERIVVNPSTQQRMLVPPKLVVNFKPIAALKEILKNNEESK